MYHTKNMIFIPVTLVFLVGRLLLVKKERTSPGLLAISFPIAIMLIHATFLWRETGHFSNSITYHWNLSTILIKNGLYHNHKRPDVTSAIGEHIKKCGDDIHNWDSEECVVHGWSRFESQLRAKYFNDNIKDYMDHSFQTMLMNFSGYLGFIFKDIYRLGHMPVKDFWYSDKHTDFFCGKDGFKILRQRSWCDERSHNPKVFLHINQSYPALKLWHIYLLILIEFTIILVNLARKRQLAWLEVWIAGSATGIIIVAAGGSWGLENDPRYIAPAVPLVLLLLSKNIDRFLKLLLPNPTPRAILQGDERK